MQVVRWIKIYSRSHYHLIIVGVVLVGGYSIVANGICGAGRISIELVVDRLPLILYDEGERLPCHMYWL